MLFVGVFSGIMKHDTHEVTMIASGIGVFLGSIISFILSLVYAYYFQGPIYAISIVQSAIVYTILYTIIGVIGASLGYYFGCELLGEEI